MTMVLLVLNFRSLLCSIINKRVLILEFLNMKTMLFLISFVISMPVFCEAHCTSSSIEECPWQYHAKCEHVECIKHKCHCYIPGDETYYMRHNYHPPLY